MRVMIGLVMAAMVMGASAQVLETKTYGTTGHPTEALVTPDGEYVLVTVNREGGGGIDVFKDAGKKLERVAFQRLGGEGAQGIVLIPGTRMIAVGVSNAGVAFANLDEVIAGKAKPGVLAQGERSGSGYLAVSPDGRYLFVANEYGEGGNIGVIALHPDAAGVLHPETVAHIRTPNTTPGVTISTDGMRVYTVGEVLSGEAAQRLPGHGVKELEHGGCVQGRPDRVMPNGVLYAIDAVKAEGLAVGASVEEAAKVVVGAVDAGCSPVREAVTADGSFVYVTARGDNRVLVFDAKAVEGGAGPLMVQAIASGGDAPVGLKLFDGGRMLLVANSNRFAGGAGSAAVFDVSDVKHAVLKQKIGTGAFPRNIVASGDGKTLYMTVFSGDELMVLREK